MKPINSLPFVSVIMPARNEASFIARLEERHARPTAGIGSDPGLCGPCAGRYEQCRTKIDELPQLLSVLMGEMSLVGPRPEGQQYAEMFRQAFEEVLTVRPGITDPASLKYCDETTLLGSAVDREAE
jgi:hypothetical protein